MSTNMQCKLKILNLESGPFYTTQGQWQTCHVWPFLVPKVPFWTGQSPNYIFITQRCAIFGPLRVHNWRMAMAETASNQLHTCVLSLHHLVAEDDKVIFTVRVMELGSQMMEFGNRKLFPGVSSGAHLRPTAHPEPVIDSPTNSAKEDTRTILKMTPERH